jgi:surface protein
MKKANYSFLLTFLGFSLLTSCSSEDEPTPIEISINSISTISVDENPANGAVLATLSGAVNRGELVFSLSNENPAGAMAVDATTGQLTVADASFFDFETNPTITATGTAEVEGVKKSATITVTVKDVDETVPTVITISDFALTINENPSNGISLGTVTATVNQGSLAYAITSQTPTGAMAIDASTGELSVTDASKFDFEANPTLTATVEASADGEKKTATATVTLTDVDETGSPFVTTWETTSANESITIPIITNNSSYTYDYAVDWGDGSTSTNQTEAATHTYANAGTYTVKISGDFAAMSFNNSGDKDKIKTIESWGTIAWRSMQGTFQGCSNLNYNATDAPDLSAVESMGSMFRSSSITNPDLSNWDVSNVTDMHQMFNSCQFTGNISNWDVSNVTSFVWTFANSSFNQDITNWDFSSVTSTNHMFFGNSGFNQDISKWDVSNIVNMGGMFRISAFSGDLSSWDVSNVVRMDQMFSSAREFNSDLSNWDVSKVVNMATMFANAVKFRSDLSGWDVSSVTNMGAIFENNTNFTSNLSN